MKAILILILSCFVTLITAQTRINELPAKTNADSTWLILTGNPSSGKLYKMSFDHLKDSIIGEVGTTIDTTSLSNRIDNKLNASDTASLSLRIDAITGGSGGGESIDSTLSIGNTTNALMIFNHDYNFNASTGIKHDQDPLIPLGTTAGYNLKLIETSEYGVNAAVGRWQENITEYQTGQEGTPTARKNVVWSFGYNIDQGIANEGYMRLGMESNYRPGGGVEWFEWHAPEVKTRDGQINRWYSITGDKGYPSATHLFHGNTYTFFDIANYPAAMLYMNNTTSTFTASTFRVYDSDGDGSRFEINHNTPAGDIYMIFDGVGTSGLVRINTDNALLFNTPSYAASFGSNGYFHLGSSYAGASQRLQVEGNARITGAIYDSNNDPGTSGQILSSTATGTDWVANKQAGGSTTQVQYNSSGVLAGNSGFTYNGTDLALAGYVYIDFALSSGYGLVGRGGGNNLFQMGFNAQANYGGTSGQISGNQFFVYNFQEALGGVNHYYWGFNNTGDNFWGSSNTLYSVRIQQPRADNIPLSILGVSGQTEDLFNVTKNGGSAGGVITVTASGNIGVGEISPTASALIEMESTTQGFLPPRMTKTQRDAISSPATGLMVYQTDNTPGLRVFNGTNWMRYTETAD